VTFSFSGGGWFQMYHFGVCSAIQDSGLLERLEAEGKSVRFCGTSAGALAAAKIASGCNLYQEMKEYAVACSIDYRSTLFPRLMKLRSYVMNGIEECARKLGTEKKGNEEKMQNAIKDGRLEIYTTTLPHMRTKVITQFTDRRGLEEALCASCNIVPLFGLPFKLRHVGTEWVCDGGLTTFQPRRGEPGTITITPFYFRSACICPGKELRPWRALYPPGKEALLAYFDHGYNDALTYLAAHGHISPEKQQQLWKELPKHIEALWVVGVEKVILFVVYLLLKPLLVVIFYVELLSYVAAGCGGGCGVASSVDVVRYVLWNSPTPHRLLLERAAPRYHALLGRLGFFLPECLEVNRSCVASFFRPPFQ